MDHALSCVLQTADGESDSVEGAAQRGARGARIEAHKAFAAAAEHLAVVEGEVRLVHEKVDARCFETSRSIFRLKMSQGFWTIVAIIAVGQLFITEVAYEFFNCAPMLHTADWSFNPSGALDLLIIVAASSLVLWVPELYRLLTNKH